MEFQDIYKDFNLKEIEQNVQNMFPKWKFSFFDIVKEVYSGNQKGIMKLLAEEVKEAFFMELQGIKDIFITIVIIMLIASVFHAFKDFFQNHQIAEISFYINFLILIIILTNLFRTILEIGESCLKNIEEFMRLFFPTYFLIVGNTVGKGTGVAYYQIAGGAIYLVEWCLVSFVLPSLSAYMLLVIMNGIWEEDRLSLLLELFQKGIKLILKVLLGILTGAGILQSMIVPMIDRIKGEAVYKAVEAIPGIGEVTEGVIRIWLGSAVLIKNSVGIVGCLLLLIFCAVPLVKILITGCLLKITSAILGIVGDKKMINCTNHVGDGIFLIFQTVFYGMLFFMVLIAITIYITNGGI